MAPTETDLTTPGSDVQASLHPGDGDIVGSASQGDGDVLGVVGDSETDNNKSKEKASDYRTGQDGN